MMACTTAKTSSETGHRNMSTNKGSRKMNTARNTQLLAAAILMSVIFTGAVTFGAVLTWGVAGGGNWDTTTSNWLPGPTTFTDDGTDDVNFTNGAGGQVDVASDMTPASVTVSATSGTYTFVGGPIDGAGSFTKTGDGILAFDLSTKTPTVNTFTGGLNLGGGEVRFANRNQLGSSSATITVNDDTTLTYAAPAPQGGTTVSNPMTIASGKTITFSRDISSHYPTYGGQISGAGGIAFASTNGNQWRISNSSNDFTGGITIAGNVSFYNDGALGNVNNTITQSGGTLTLSTGDYSASRTLTRTGGGINAGGGAVWNGIISGTGFVQSGHLTMTNANNSFSSSIQVNQGTLTVTNPGALDGARLSMVNAQLTPRNAVKVDGTPAGSFASIMNWAGYDLVVLDENAVIDWTGNLYGTSSYDTIKSGPGTLKTSTFDVGSLVTVEDGTLLMNDTSTEDLGGFQVDTGATLGGNGSISLATGNSVTVNGTLAPGESVGQLTIDGGTVSFGADSFFDIEISGVDTAGTDYGQLVIGPDGAVSIADGATLSTDFSIVEASLGDAVYILDNQGGSPISGLFQYGEDELIGTYGGLKWLITYEAVAGGALEGGAGIALYAVPEPSSLIILGFAGIACLRRRHRA